MVVYDAKFLDFDGVSGSLVQGGPGDILFMGGSIHEPNSVGKGWHLSIMKLDESFGISTTNAVLTRFVIEGDICDSDNWGY